MSLILRSLMRDPLVTRPLSRALARRLDDHDLWFDEWPSNKVRRLGGGYDSPVSIMDDVSRQMVAAMNRMQHFAEDLDTLDTLVSRLDKDSPGRARSGGVKRRIEEASLKRTESGGLQLSLDVSDFKPEDLKIKLQDDNLLVEGVCEHSGKDSYRRNHFKRWFKLPEDCKLEEIKSRLTEDNQLLIELPTRKPVENNHTRSIPIEMDKPKQQGNESVDSQKEKDAAAK